MLEPEEIDGLVSSSLDAGCMEDLPAAAREKLKTFIAEVALWSGRIHLIGRDRLAENLRLQLTDSVLLLGATEREAPHALGGTEPRFADIGSGAGFPGIVWKIARPHALAVLFERRLKAHAFLERALSTLGLAGAEAVDKDAAAYSELGSFDVVVSKAAGRFGDMLPLAERLLAPGGIYVTIKGGAWRMELAGAKRSGLEQFSELELPQGRGAALLFEKAR